MRANKKSKNLNKSLAYLLIASLIPCLSIAETVKKNKLETENIELHEIEVKDHLAKTYLKKRTSTATKTDTRIRDIPQSI